MGMFDVFKDVIGKTAAPFVTGPLDLLGVEKHNLPIVGGLFENPNEQALLREYQQAADQYRAFAPVQGDARMNALGSQLAAYQPMNNMLGQMGGPQAQIPMDKVFADPRGQGYPGAPSARSVFGGR
jgi:hypothetical protein